uniref:Uncharacterized protein n=1 Tax=viral metagenome TaxID=1070528 RepID=A0A6C0JSL5_9ZZZZ
MSKREYYNIPDNFPFDVLIKGGNIKIDGKKIKVPRLTDSRIKALTRMIFKSWWISMRLSFIFFKDGRYEGLKYFFGLDWSALKVERLIHMLSLFTTNKYDEDGYDENGYDIDGYDRDGWTKEMERKFLRNLRWKELKM